MNSLLEYQIAIAAALNADETLRQGGCTALAEDSKDLLFEVARCVDEQGEVAIVVTTPEAERLGDDDGAIAVEIPALEIVCVEKPGVNRTRDNAATALQAAQRVARVLDSPELHFLRIRQESDDRAGTLSAIASFQTSATLDLA